MIENNILLPNSHNLPVSKLASIFGNTTNSYKYLFFTALINLMENSFFEKNIFSIDNIYAEMLTFAWYPHTYFKLNFGSQDKIGMLLDKMGDSIESTGILANNFRENLKKLLKPHTKEISKALDRYVKFRLLRPFFANEVQGLEGTHLHKKIKQLAYNNLNKYWPLYYISNDESEIIVPPPWINYISVNIRILKNFAAWEWLDYMQKMNPSVPALQKKLFPPLTRENLSVQTNYWKHVLEVSPLPCIFTGKPLHFSDFFFVHFFTWPFVAQNQLWNLVPVTRSINSSKSDKLPSLDKYFAGFADIQYKALNIYYSNPGRKSWNKIIEPYITDLKINEIDLLNKTKLTKAIEDTVKPLYSLARNQGFSPDWVYTKK